MGQRFDAIALERQPGDHNARRGELSERMQFDLTYGDGTRAG
jgi:hypothetical protein